MGYQIKTILLLGFLSSILVFLGGLVAPQYIALYAGGALLSSLMAYFYSDKMVLKMHNAREVGAQDAPELYGMVEELAQKAGLPMPKVYIMQDDSPNAFATGRNPDNAAVAATTGIMRVLSPRELRGVMAHELGHVQNRDILLSTIAAMMVTMITVAARVGGQMGRRRDSRGGGGGGIGTMILLLVAPIGASIVKMCISRSREYMADEAGARISGDPLALASALEKISGGGRPPLRTAEPATASMFIVSPFSGASSVMALFSTHPPMDDRIRRLRAMAQ